MTKENEYVKKANDLLDQNGGGEMVTINYCDFQILIAENVKNKAEASYWQKVKDAIIKLKSKP